MMEVSIVERVSWSLRIGPTTPSNGDLTFLQNGWSCVSGNSMRCIEGTSI